MDKRYSVKRRILPIFLTIVMIMSMTGSAFAESFFLFENEEDKQTLLEGTVPADAEDPAPENDAAGNGDDQQDEGDGSGTDGNAANSGAGTEYDGMTGDGGTQDGGTAGTGNESVPEAADTALRSRAQPDNQTQTDNQTSVSEIRGISVTEDGFGKLTIRIPEVAGATEYRVSASNYKNGRAMSLGSNRVLVINDAARSTRYTFKAEAYGPAAAGSGKQDPVKLAEGYADSYTTRSIIYEGDKRRAIGASATAAADFGINLRTMIGEDNSGYAVTQGAATDGTYDYFLMVSSSTQKGRVLKLFHGSHIFAGAGPVLNIHHGNGMTYDSKRKQLVCVGYDKWRQQLTFIDPNSLKITAQTNLSYPYSISGMKESYKKNGIAAIAYIPKYNVYVARSRGDSDSGGLNDIMVFNADSLRCIGYIKTAVNKAYPATYQAMDADERYVYFLISPGSNQPNNRIICLDWNSENLIPVANGEKAYVESAWSCNDNGSGQPDRVLNIPVSYEAEGLFHTDVRNSDGTTMGHFYLSAYHGSTQYQTVTRKVLVKKKKVKKVRKWWHKKKKKWVAKKPKKKYRGRSKMVWKYKKQYKYVTEKGASYWGRDDYVYDLGSF